MTESEGDGFADQHRRIFTTVGQIMSHPLERPPEIVGFGALNVDYIGSASRMSERMAEVITESAARFEWNREVPVDEDTIMRAMRQLGMASLGSSLGGSAWLATFALAQMRIGIRLGYVGVVGRVEAPGLSFLNQMNDLRIDHRWVGQRPDLPCGLCLSYLDDADRVMLTYPGANTEVGAHIRENLTELARYLASAKCVHVTSFLDEHTPREVLRVLRDAKARNSKLRLSFDPGFDWAERPTPTVEGILALTDLLFINYREFKALGHYAHGEPDDVIARKVLARCAPGCTAFVTKRYDVVEVFSVLPDGLREDRFRLRRPIAEVAVEDATGAGDVFVAGVLASLMSRRLQVELGAHVGLSLARHRLLHRDDVDGPPLPDLSAGFLRTHEDSATAGRYPAGVFIVHDDNPQHEVVRRFIEEHCGVPAREAGAASMGEGNPAEALAESLSRCSFAVCLLSARDTMPDGRRRAAQNIVHQAGIFQGRYGFSRVALLAEQGCDTFSNIAGLIRLEFPPGQVERTFHELERMLRREGLVSR